MYTNKKNRNEKTFLSVDESVLEIDGNESEQKSGKGTLKNSFRYFQALIRNKLKIAPSTIITIIMEILERKLFIS